MNNLKYGIVSEVKPGFVRVQFEEDDFVSDWLPVLVRRSRTEKHSWQLEVNEHVVCLMDEHCEEGVVLGAIPNDEDTPDPGEGAGKCRILFSDGTLFEYNVNTGKMTVDVKGDLEAKTTGHCSIDAGTELKGNAGIKASVVAPTIELTGNVQINGPLVVSGAMLAGGIATTGGGSIVSEGDIITTGGIQATGDVVAGTTRLKSHIHPGVQPGAGSTGTPI